MLTWNTLIGVIVLIAIFIRTLSFSLWTFKRKNYTGAIAILIIDIFIIVFPFYLVFLR